MINLERIERAYPERHALLLQVPTNILKLLCSDDKGDILIGLELLKTCKDLDKEDIRSQVWTLNTRIEAIGQSRYPDTWKFSQL